MSISATTGAAGNSSSAVSSLALPSFTITAGQSIAVAISLGSTSSSVSSITDTKGNTYVFQAAQNGTGVRTELWVSYNVLAQASNIITINITGGATSIAAAVEEYKDVFSKPIQSTYYIQGNTSAIQTTTAATVSFPSANTSSNLLVLGISVFGTNANTNTSISSIVDTGGNTWNLIDSTGLSNSKTWLYAAYNCNSAGAGNVVTVTFGGGVSVDALLLIAEYQHINSSPLDVNRNDQPGNATTITTGSLTTTANNELVIMLLYDQNGSAHVNSTIDSATRQTNIDPFNGKQVIMTDQALTATGTYTFNAESSSGSFNSCQVITATFKTSTTPSGPFSPNTGTINGGSTSTNMYENNVLTTQKSSFVVGALGFACQSGDTLTAVSGTSRQSSIPAATAVGVALYDNTAVLESTIPVSTVISSARNWATVAVELHSGNAANSAAAYHAGIVGIDVHPSYNGFTNGQPGTGHPLVPFGIPGWAQNYYDAASYLLYVSLLQGSSIGGGGAFTFIN